jgi:hypothetical protein
VHQVGFVFYIQLHFFMLQENERALFTDDILP